MNILYITMSSIDESSGVYKKIIGQTKAMEDLGHFVNILFLTDFQSCTLKNKNISQVLDFENEWKQIESLIDMSNAIYFRFELLRHSTYKKCFNYCYKKNKKIILEIPTYPPHQESLARAKSELNKGSWINALKIWIGSFYVRYNVYKQAKLSTLVCLVADNKKFKGTKTIRIENGIDVGSIPFLLKEQDCNKKINIIAVSNFSVWNGYDRIITGLKSLPISYKKRLQLTFVGNKEKASDLINLSKRLGVSSLVTFTGELDGNRLHEAYSNADIALGALGNHRRKVYANSSLKAKEYAAYGKIMILSEAEGIEEDLFKLCYIVPSNDNPIDLKDVIDWYDNIKDLSFRCTFIRKYAEDNYTWEKQVIKILREIS